MKIGKPDSIGREPRQFTVDGRKFNSMYALSKHYGVSLSKIWKGAVVDGKPIRQVLGLSGAKFTDECIAYIYLVENSLNAKKYVGVTTRKHTARWYEHITAANSVSYANTNLTKAIRKLGIENFSIRVLCRCASKTELSRKEKLYIKKFDTLENGYNARDGGNGIYGNRGKPIQYEGRLFENQSALAKHLGVSSCAISHRRLKGQRVAGIKSKRKRGPFKFRGVEYRHLKDFMQRNSMNYYKAVAMLGTRGFQKGFEGEAKIRYVEKT